MASQIPYILTIKEMAIYLGYRPRVHVASPQDSVLILPGIITIAES